MSENTAPDDAPELRKLLDEIHGDTPSMFDQDDDDEAEKLEALADVTKVVEKISMDDEMNDEQSTAEELVNEPTNAPISEPVSSPIEQAEEPVSVPEVYVNDINEMPLPLTESGVESNLEPGLESYVSDSGEEMSADFFSTPAAFEPSENAEEIAEEFAQQAEPLYVAPPEHLQHDLQNMPVMLDCSLKTLQKPLGEVSQLQEGEIIPLGCGPDAPIELKVNGRTFALGRLVMVEDELAVEITHKLS